MKKDRGFTLIELLAVIALIALLALVVVPSVMNVITGNKDKLDSTTTKLIYTATENYLDYNQTEYIKEKGAVYCVSIQTLIDNGFLEENLVDTKTGEPIDKNYIVKSSYVKDLFKNKYEYEILIDTNCTDVKPEIKGEHIAIEELQYYRIIDDEEGSKTKVYNAVETFVNVPVITSKINDDTQLTLKIRRGKNYVNSVFIITGGIVNNNKAEFLVTVPSSASIGEYVIEVTNGDNKATKNLRIYINPIMLFMGD